MMFYSSIYLLTFVFWGKWPVILVVVVPVWVVNVRLLTRPPWENGVGGDRPQLHIVTQDFADNRDVGGVLDHLLKHATLVQQVPNSGLKLRLRVFPSLHRPWISTERFLQRFLKSLNNGTITWKWVALSPCLEMR